MKVNQTIYALLVVTVLLFPYLTLASFFGGAKIGNMAEIWWAFKNTIFQSSLSALFSVLLGVLAGLGIISVERLYGLRIRRFIEYFCLIPSMLPAIFVILAVLDFVNPFPFGIWGIAIVHIFMNTGLVAVMFSVIARNKVARLAELALVEGASRWLFFKYGLIGILRRDLALMFLFVFATCFGSFSVPLIVGGALGTTVEVLIYEKITIAGEWSQALSLSLMQTLALLLVSWVAPPNYQFRSMPFGGNMKLLELRFLYLLPIVFSAIVLFFPLRNLPEGYSQLKAIGFSWSLGSWAIFNSLSIGLLTGALVFALGIFVFGAFNTPLIFRFVRSYLAPGAVLTAFAILLVPPLAHLPGTLKIALGMAIFLFPSLFRWLMDSGLNEMDKQIETARVLGAGSQQILWHIITPQLSPTLGYAAGLAGAWAAADFAFSKMLFSSNSTLGLIVEGLMSHYRLSAATVLSSILLLLGAVIFLFFLGVGRVLSRKLS